MKKKYRCFGDGPSSKTGSVCDGRCTLRTKIMNFPPNVCPFDCGSVGFARWVLVDEQ